MAGWLVGCHRLFAMLKLKEPFFNACRIGTILFLSKVVRAAEEVDMNNWAVRLAGFEVAPSANHEGLSCEF
jgi:hypothetical protein